MNTKHTILNVTGMTCASCVRHVNHALRELPGVQDVQVDLTLGKVTIEQDATSPEIPALIAALTEAGYEATADV